MKYKWGWHHLLLPLEAYTHKIFAPCYHDFMLCSPRGFSSKRSNFTKKYINVSIKLKVKICSTSLGSSGLKSAGKKKGDNVLSGAIGPDNQGETGQLLYSGGKEEYIWNIDFLEHQIVVPWFVSIASGKLQSCASRLWLTRNTEIMVWVTLPGKEPPLAEVLAESRGNTAWVIEEDSVSTSFEHTTSYRNKDLFIMLWLCWMVCVCV